MDLKKAFEGNDAQGVFHFSGGEIGYTNVIANGDGTFNMRYESGWYCTYRNNGIRPVAGIILHNDGTKEYVPGGDKRNIIKFESMTWEDAIKKYQNIAGGFRP